MDGLARRSVTGGVASIRLSQSAERLRPGCVTSYNKLEFPMTIRLDYFKHADPAPNGYSHVALLPPGARIAFIAG